jgi:superfamily II DNA helicase RecQ
MQIINMQYYSVAEWGYGFRRSYQEIRKIKERITEFATVPILAVTATANDHIQVFQ